MSRPSTSGLGLPTPDDSEADRRRPGVPGHPQLDTLWVSVASKEEIASLREMLADCAALGFPIRCVIVHHCFAVDAKPAVGALLRALEGDAEEVILTRTRASEFRRLREVDWVERLPDTFELPAALRRGWPTRWYETDPEGDPEY